MVFINYPLETFTPTSSGAIATVIWELCRVARCQGIEPTVISRSCEIKPYEWSRTIFLDYPPIPKNPWVVKLLGVQRKISGWRHLRQRNYAIKIADAIRKAGLINTPLVLHNDPELAVFLRHSFPNAFILHWFHNPMVCKPRIRFQFARAVNVIVAVSDFTGRWIENYYGIKKKRVHTIYNGVDLDQFRPSAEPSTGPPVISFVGRTGIEKAPDLLLRAARQLSKKNKNFKLQIIGSNHWDKFEFDDYQRQLQYLAEDLERDGIPVDRPGHIDRELLPEVFRRAHIHVTPSRWDEPFGLTTLEGMASGLATIASNTGGSPEVIGDAGFLFERDSVDGLAQHLFNLITNEELRMKYAQKARNRSKEFTWEKTWEQLKRLVSIS